VLRHRVFLSDARGSRQAEVLRRWA